MPNIWLICCSGSLCKALLFTTDSIQWVISLLIPFKVYYPQPFILPSSFFLKRDWLRTTTFKKLQLQITSTNTHTLKYSDTDTNRDFATPLTVYVVSAAVVGQSHVVFNQGTLAVIGCKQNQTNSHFFQDLGTKIITRRYRLTGVSILLCTGLYGSVL